MFAQSLSRAAIMATICFAGLTSAVRESGGPSPAIVSKSTTSARAHERNIGNPEDKVMVSCAGHITQCGVEDKAKIIYVPKFTETITNTIVRTDTVVLPTSTRVIESVTVETITNTTKGHCRDTVFVTGEPITIAVDVVSVITEEIQPVSNTTSWITSTVTASAIEQCFLENKSTLGQGPGSQGLLPEAAPVHSTDSASPAASEPAASDEILPADDPAQIPLDTDDERYVIVDSAGELSE